MEAASVPPRQPGAIREADVAPAPAEPTHHIGWSPADPGPLGLASFATTTFTLSIFNAKLVNPVGTFVVLGLALAVGGLAQLIAGIWEFRTGNTFGAVAFTSYGGFWISFFLLLRVTPVASLNSHAIAVYLYAWTIFTLYMFVASLRTTGAVALVFLLLFVTFLLLAIGQASTAPAGSAALSSSVYHIGGYLGIVTAIVAWYTSFAGVANATFGRVLLPVFPLAR